MEHKHLYYIDHTLKQKRQMKHKGWKKQKKKELSKTIQNSFLTPWGTLGSLVHSFIFYFYSKVFSVLNESPVVASGYEKNPHPTNPTTPLGCTSDN